MVFVGLYGAAIDVNIRLDKNSVIMEKTYISLANQRTITIHNRSNIIAHFQWKIFATQEEEDREKYRFVTETNLEKLAPVWGALWELCNIKCSVKLNLALV